MKEQEIKQIVKEGYSNIAKSQCCGSSGCCGSSKKEFDEQIAKQIGYSDEEILNYLKAEIRKKRLAVIYIHDLYECINKIPLLEKLLLFLKESKVAIKTIKQIARDKK